MPSVNFFPGGSYFEDEWKDTPVMNHYHASVGEPVTSLACHTQTSLHLHAHFVTNNLVTERKTATEKLGQNTVWEAN